jgi:lipoprotein-anchoring transpeptidase ErfK/SrfK
MVMHLHCMGRHMIKLPPVTSRPPRICRASILIGASLVACSLFSAAAGAQALGYAPAGVSGLPRGLTPQGLATNAPAREDQNGALPERLRRALVDFNTNEAPGTIIIDTADTALYYVLGGGRAVRYGVGVGRQGFTWSGVETVSHKAEWPDWYPPSEMIARQPYLPRFVAGGPGNPLGARAIYLGASEYRIHGTNDPTTIGKFVSSGCIRMTNEDVIDLFNRVNVGSKVVVLSKHAALQARAPRPTPARPVVTASPSGRQAMTLQNAVVD